MSMEWDGLRGCEICGNDTTGRLCHSCAHQEMIDNSDFAPTSCPVCQTYQVVFDWKEDGDGWQCQHCVHELWVAWEKNK